MTEIYVQDHTMEPVNKMKDMDEDDYEPPKVNYMHKLNQDKSTA